MPVYRLSNHIIFPPVSLAEPDGLLAVGGDLSPERLQLAYRSGIFPWPSSEEQLLWYAPDPRFVLFPADIHVSHSMKSVIRKKIFRITHNLCFADVIHACSQIKRKNQSGTWITHSIEQAYTKLHELGLAHSVEVWSEGSLVGGLYGVLQGKVFCGESMFSKVPNASKQALLELPKLFKDLRLIDCQIYTKHLEQMGARFITREEFLAFLKDDRAQNAK